VKDKYSEDSVVVRETLHHLAIQNQLLTMENSGLQQALKQQRKSNKKSRSLPLIQRQDWEAGTQWWSPSRVTKAQRLLDEADEAEKADEIRKADKKALQESTRLLKQKLDAEKAEAREKEIKERDEKKAAERKAIDERKAERARKKQERDSQKAIQTQAKGKRKAPPAVARPKKRSCRAVDNVGGDSAAPLAPAPPAKTSNSGRNITLPKKYI
jgi:membrane protein involved in colicin uptake